MVRSTLKYVANKDMKAFAKDLKTIYTAPNEETASNHLKTVTEKGSVKNNAQNSLQALAE